MILKFKKTWIGVREVTFFGFKVYDGKWELSEKRIEAIKAIIFPTSKKLMQSFLGAALFFHHHIPMACCYLLLCFKKYNTKRNYSVNSHFSGSIT